MGQRAAIDMGASYTLAILTASNISFNNEFERTSYIDKSAQFYRNVETYNSQRKNQMEFASI